jgi:hypothetical protein
VKRELLNAAARAALEKQHGECWLARSQGAAPGTRLTYTDSGETKEAAIRTSKDGTLGLQRDSQGHWRTLDKVQLVVVATPSGNPSLIDVYGLDPKVLKAEFNRKVKDLEKGNSDPDRFKAPVFLALGHRRGIGRWKGLPHLWKDEIKKADLPALGFATSSAQALEVIRVGIAQTLGVQPHRVELSFSFRVKP